MSNVARKSWHSSSSAPLPLYTQTVSMGKCHFLPPKYVGPTAEEAMALRKMHYTPLATNFKKPVMVTNGHMQYMFDQAGRRYLDMFAGVVTVSVGHRHPVVVDALKSQIDKIMHTTVMYLSPQLGLYAKELTEKLPTNLSKVFFVNSGSEANEMAITLSRLYTQNFELVSLRSAYHGSSAMTMGAGGISAWKYNIPQGLGIHHIATPNVYRGVVPKSELVSHHVEDLKDAITGATPGAIAAFMHETIQGVAGSIPLPAGYLSEAYQVARSYGGLCIADEVQTGFGRCGTHYWGFETQGVVPDIVTLAKGIGNGFPLGAVITTPEIMQVLNQRLLFNTYGGNPMACAVGRAVLKVIDEDGLQENCAHLGGYMFAQLRKLQERYEILGDVRGRGLMIGCEFVKDRDTKEPAKTEVTEIHEILKSRGVLVGKGGVLNNVLRIKPPMCINQHDVDFFVYHLEQAIRQISGLSVNPSDD